MVARDEPDVDMLEDVREVVTSTIRTGMWQCGYRAFHEL